MLNNININTWDLLLLWSGIGMFKIITDCILAYDNVNDDCP